MEIQDRHLQDATAQPQPARGDMLYGLVQSEQLLRQANVAAGTNLQYIGGDIPKWRRKVL